MAQDKICCICNKELPIDYFSVNKAKSDGYSSHCKKCESDRKHSYYRTKKGLLSHIYSHQLEGCRIRGHEYPKYSSKELREWAYSQPKFHELYDKWVASGYERLKRPSIDRINDYKTYEFGNIQLMTFYENVKKYHSDAKNGINTKTCKAIVSIDSENKVVRYHSINHAGRMLKIDTKQMIRCCKNRPGAKTSLGFKFMYETDYLKTV